MSRVERSYGVTLVEVGAAGAVHAVAGEDPRHAEVPETGDGADRAHDGGRHGQRVEHRRAQGHQPRDSIGIAGGKRACQRPSPALADDDHRSLQLAQFPLETSELSAGAADVDQHPAAADLMPAPPNHPASAVSEASPAMKPGIQEHQVAARRAGFTDGNLRSTSSLASSSQ